MSGICLKIIEDGASGLVVIDGRVMTVSSLLYNFCHFCILLEISIKNKISVRRWYWSCNQMSGKTGEGPREECPGCGRARAKALRHNQLGLSGRKEVSEDKWVL